MDFKKVLLAKIHAALKPSGFRKTGNTFFSEQDDVVLFIQLQSSSRSTKDVLVATVNLGIFSLSLALKVGNTRRPNILDAHWRERLGYFLPAPHDKWWEVASDEEANVVGEKIAELVQSAAMPAMFGIASTAKLKSLWETGKSPGLTEYQRQQYLRALN